MGLVLFLSLKTAALAGSTVINPPMPPVPVITTMENCGPELANFHVCSLRGMFTNALDAKKFKNPINKTTLPIDPAYFTSGKAPVYTYLQPHPAPIAVYLTGMFAESSAPLLNRGIYRLAAQGYHVFAPANPWTLRSLKYGPQAPLGELGQEAQSVVEATRVFLDSLPKDLVLGSQARVSYLMGDSYGALLGGAVLAQAQHLESWQGVRSLLVAPPHDLHSTAQIMDSVMDEEEDFYFDGPCQMKFPNMVPLVMGVAAPLPLYLPYQERCAKATMALMVFNRSIARFLAFKEGRLDDWKNESDHRQFRKLRFHSFAEAFPLPAQGSFSGTPTGSLTHWAQQWGPGVWGQTHVLVAANDLIAPPGGWQEEPWAQNPHFGMMKGGGHLGFSVGRQFMNYFAQFFPAYPPQ